ncbi:PilT/PilU family type 4a pilus ATPase [Thauera mechernichensis]|uniref:type IV pilus twitching motility protein PilT n=1 Tax=Thauera sp. 27 TaxID=305700 RepID=UPI0002CE886B|nr:ATPase, T2SS/T4P/T4SS family [Thauera sp. 27]ENO77600.1 twitching motility protein [Thauera sp. 27]
MTHSTQLSGAESTAVTEVLLKLANSELNFSDVHIELDRPIKVRMPYGWEEIDDSPLLTHSDITDFLQITDPEWKTNIEQHAISRAIDLYSCRLRLNAFKAGGGRSLVISVRRQPLQPLPLEATGLPMYLRTQVSHQRGLILVTGHTGAGKTMTMASLLDNVNRNRSAHIITIEDPIEFVHERNRSIISSKEVGIDTPSFAQGLRDSLRQKPDVIMVGEIRDHETADTVFAAAESGHLVLASLHTNSVLGAINKMLSWFPDETAHRSRMLADSLLCVISQTLIPSADGKRRVLAPEILLNQDKAVTECLEKPEKHSMLRDFMHESRDKMSQSLNNVLVNLVRDGKITDREAMRNTNDRVGLMGLLNGMPH